MGFKKNLKTFFGIICVILCCILVIVTVQRSNAGETTPIGLIFVFGIIAFFLLKDSKPKKTESIKIEPVIKFQINTTSDAPKVRATKDVKDALDTSRYTRHGNVIYRNDGGKITDEDIAYFNYVDAVNYKNGYRKESHCLSCVLLSGYKMYSYTDKQFKITPDEEKYFNCLRSKLTDEENANIYLERNSSGYIDTFYKDRGAGRIKLRGKKYDMKLYYSGEYDDFESITGTVDDFINKIDLEVQYIRSHLENDNSGNFDFF